jgi:DNA repair protein SbcC/Rad50
VRPHRLEVTAFGPFAETAAIDFDVLADTGLFLIHGQTGAGKSSVLDAVCFALYGQVAGARNAVRRLRSDHAPAALAPRVVLEVTVRGRRLRITRSPAWQRPKKRGTGTTQEQARVMVEEYVAGSWTGRSTRLDEAGDFIGGLLGLTAEQFCQVALLPQGEFAAFLRAGAEERHKVLERLFSTEIFTRVEGWLAERRAATRRAADDLRAAAESIADRVAEAAGTQRPDADAGDALVAWATELTGQLGAVEVVTGSLLAESAAGLESARAAAQRARTLADRQRRHADAVRRRDVLAAKAGERAELAANLAAATRADQVRPLLRAVAERARAAEDAGRRAAAARAAVTALIPPNDTTANAAGPTAEEPAADTVGWAGDRAGDTALAAAERVRRDEMAGLDRLRGDADRLGAIGADIGRARQAGERLDEREAALSAALAELPGQVEGLRAELAAADRQAAGRPGAVAAVDDAARRAAAAERRDELLGALAAAEAGHRAAVDAAQELRDRVQELRQARLDGMAAVLAGDLAAGEPCRVCGSPDHPTPAEALGGIPTDDDEDRVQAAYEQAQADREEAAARVAELGAELDAARDLAADRTLDALTAELADAEAELDAIDAATATAERIAAELDAAEAGLAEARDQREEIIRRLAENSTKLAELEAESGRLRARLDAARGDDPSLEARVERLGREAAALHAAVEAVRESATAERELAAAGAAAERAAERQGFESAAAAVHAALPDEARSELTARGRAFDAEEAAVHELLGDPELTEAAALPAPDIAAVEAALTAAERRHTAVASAADRARQRRARLAELRAELIDRVAAWRPAADRHAVAVRLAGLTSGQPGVNRLSMRLSAYVLAARLEQVVAAANERLARMSAGRYALVHTVDRAAGDRRGGSGGLGLRIVDAWTGQERDPVTLSGGESFITSLSLALGLADVVTVEAGGTEIGTLFVDEGFGSLDDETLDEVMDVLDGLRDGGRAVGIVSHVAELRARIPAQLHVRKTRTGSHLEVAGA